MLAIALMNEILFQRKSILLQTQYTLNRLELSLLKQEQRAQMEEVPRGMNALIKSILAGTGTREMLMNCCVSLKNHKIDFLPGPYNKSREVYEEEMDATITEILYLAEQCCEYLYVDSGVSKNPNSMKVLEEADLIVMNLSQNKRILDDLLNHSLLRNKNICYLIGNYDPKSQYNKTYLFRNYKKLNKENTFFIPYNTEFRDAVSEATVTTFFLVNFYCEEEDENRFFIEEVKNAARKIYNIAFNLEEKKEKDNFTKEITERLLKSGDKMRREKIPGEKIGGELGAT